MNLTILKIKIWKINLTLVVPNFKQLIIPKLLYQVIFCLISISEIQLAIVYFERLLYVWAIGAISLRWIFEKSIKSFLVLLFILHQQIVILNEYILQCIWHRVKEGIFIFFLSCCLEFQIFVYVYLYFILFILGEISLFSIILYDLFLNCDCILYGYLLCNLIIWNMFSAYF